MDLPAYTICNDFQGCQNTLDGTSPFTGFHEGQNICEGLGSLSELTLTSMSLEY